MTALTSPLRLEHVTDVLGTSHLNRVAKRYSGEKGLNGKAASRDALIRALDSPARLDALVASLHPVERSLLSEMRRHGGAMDGWALYTFARLRGLPAPPVKVNPYSANLFGGHRGATFPGAEVIWALLADGLLFPASVPNPWVLNAYAYYHHRPFPDLPASWLLADPRLLSHLPPLEALPMKVTFARVPSPERPAAAPSGVLLALRFQELLRGLHLTGGLGVTQAGTYNKSALGKLGRVMPALQDPELWLTLAQHLGLLQADAGGRHVQAHPGAVRALSVADLQGRVAGIVGALHLPEDDAHLLPHAGALRACLVALLRDLPHATTERDLLRVMKEVIPADLRAQRHDYRQVTNPDAWITWVGITLRGVMTDLGLVVMEDREGMTVLTSNVGMNASLPTQAGPESAGIGTRPAPLAWILQPNFELLVFPAHLQAHQFVILSAAEAARFDIQTATYRLTRESVYAALEHGLNLKELLDGLQASSATPLSAGVQGTIRDWAARRERVTLRQGVTLLEYPTRSKRDAALRARGTAVGDTLLMLQPGQPLPHGVTTLNYDVAPPKSLKFSADGSFTVTGELDFLTRSLLAGRIAAVRPQQYVIRPATPGQLPRSFLTDLEARSSTRLPAPLRLQLGIWSGAVPPPNVATITVIQHPQAQALAQHPSLKALIGISLSPSLLTVHAGKEAAFETALHALGLTPNREIMPAQDAASDLLVLTDTRKKREFLEEAIRNGHELLLQYTEEKYVSSGWNGSRVTTGKRRLDELRPLQVDRQGSTPYLDARDLKTGEEVRIRVQYILGMAIR
ncbi:helicase-associated domain-containing protein [Deinococcus sp. SM5_A1]|uniref:helicase-associated domain-containing protein n=1 Tax=Deinococcus sp. SM5_A1 TaxID=3379094 RepID=UPI00385A3620